MRRFGGRAAAFGLAALVATMVPAVSPPAGADTGTSSHCTTSWATATDGDWHDPTRWTDGVPDAEDDACIEGAAAHTVTLDADGRADSLVLAGGATLRVEGAGTELRTFSAGVLAGATLALGDGAVERTGDLSVAGTLDLGGAGTSRSTAHVVEGGVARLTYAPSSHGTAEDLAVSGTLALTLLAAPTGPVALYQCSCHPSPCGFCPLPSGPIPPPAHVTVTGPEAVVFTDEDSVLLRPPRPPALRSALGVIGAIWDTTPTEAPPEVVDALAAGTLTRARLARDLATSRSYLDNEVRRIYQAVARRAATAAERDWWIDAIATGRSTPARLTSALFASDEYLGRWGRGSLTGWVEGLYRDVLGRTPPAADRDWWVAQAEAHGRPVVARRLVQSPEARRRRATALLTGVLGRAVAPAERDWWADRLLAEGDHLVRARLAGTAELDARAQRVYR